MSKRNYDDPKWKECRRIVLRRDNYKCKKCGGRRKLQVHHIVRWADSPSLRYDINNCITLCRSCHQKIWGKEKHYQLQCRLLLNKKLAGEVLQRIWKIMKDQQKENI